MRHKEPHRKPGTESAAESAAEHDPGHVPQHGPASGSDESQILDPDAVEPEDIEPAVDPDSKDRMAEELPEPPHPATRLDAGTGQGTVSGPPRDSEFQERPILDGSTQGAMTEASVPNPHRGQTDPALEWRQPAVNSASTNRWLFSGIIAFVVVAVVLFVLYPWDPVWCSIGIGFALVALLVMIGVRATRLRLKVRLRVEAALLALIWLVPLAIIFTVLGTSADEIW